MRTWRGAPAPKSYPADMITRGIPSQQMQSSSIRSSSSGAGINFSTSVGACEIASTFSWGICRPSVHAADQACFPHNTIARGRKEDAGKVTVSLTESRMMKTSVVFDPLSVAQSNATGYPEPDRADNQKRWNRRLGDHAGLQNFGVNLTRIAPGGQSSARHWHSKQDEFVYVLSGTVILETNAGEQVLQAGSCAGFPQGAPDGHRFVNRSGEDVLLLVVGDRTAGDEITYPDIDMQARLRPDGRYEFRRKDGDRLMKRGSRQSGSLLPQKVSSTSHLIVVSGVASVVPKRT